MFRMVIKSNHDKICRENRFSVEEFDDLLRWICIDTGYTERSNGEYCLESGYDIGRMVVLKAKFKKLGYIVPNLSKWITYYDDGDIIDELK